MYSNIQHQFLGKKDKIPNDIFHVTQIHSNIVYVIDNISKIITTDNSPEADAIVTNQKNIKISVKTADCVPILLYYEFQKKPNIISVIHAGWKGAKKNIIDNVIFEMNKLGAENHKIKAIIGPSIRQKSYQVSQEFYDDFLEENQSYKQFFINCPIKNDHFLFDLVGFVKIKLSNNDISYIMDENIDTYDLKNNFFSYRRFCNDNIHHNGRNISYISLLS